MTTMRNNADHDQEQMFNPEDFEEGSDTMKVLVSVIIGMAAGAALGVLFAPDKGTETRRKISRQSKEYVNSLKNTASEYVDNIASKLESVKGAASEMAGQAREAVSSIAGSEPRKQTQPTTGRG